MSEIKKYVDKWCEMGKMFNIEKIVKEYSKFDGLIHKNVRRYLGETLM